MGRQPIDLSELAGASSDAPNTARYAKLLDQLTAAEATMQECWLFKTKATVITGYEPHTPRATRALQKIIQIVEDHLAALVEEDLERAQRRGRHKDDDDGWDDGGVPRNPQPVS